MKIHLYTKFTEGTGKLYLNITPDEGKRFLLYTGITCREKPVGMVFSRKEPNAASKTKRLSDIYAQCEDYGYRNPGLTAADLKEGLSRLINGKSKSNGRLLLDSLDEFMSTKTNKGTLTCYGITRKKIVQFCPTVQLDNLDKSWITRFATWMEQSGMSVNAYAIHLRNIRAVMNYAIDNGYTTNYPFRKYKIRQEPTMKRSLSVEQIRQLRDWPVEPWQEEYRDMFLLMFYLIGINAADLFQARKHQIVNGRLEYVRQKTHKAYSVKVEPEAEAIIRRYQGKDWLLSPLDRYASYKDYLHHMGDALKKIGTQEKVLDKAGKRRKIVYHPIIEGLSTYYARHSWATIASELDIPIETISQALGHSYGLSVTDIYIRHNAKKVDDANRRVIDYINQSKLSK